MKVTCSACGLRYAISDKRILGRKLKLSCKRCSKEVIFDGTRSFPAEEDAATPVFEPEWPVRRRADADEDDAATPIMEPEPTPGQEHWVDDDELTPVQEVDQLVEPPSWVIELDGREEKMTTHELVELCTRKIVDDNTRVRELGSKKWRELSSVRELKSALEARSGARSKPDASPVAAPALRSDAEISASSRELDAQELWAAAGVKPGKRAAKAQDGDEPTFDEPTTLFDRTKGRRVAITLPDHDVSPARDGGPRPEPSAGGRTLLLVVLALVALALLLGVVLALNALR